MGEVAPESGPGITTTDPIEQAGPTSESGADDNPTNLPADESPPDRGGRASINDVWTQYYAQYDPKTPALINVCHTIHFNQPKGRDRPTSHTEGKSDGRTPPPILIDTGASCSAVGKNGLRPGETISFPLLGSTSIGNSDSATALHFGA